MRAILLFFVILTCGCAVTTPGWVDPGVYRASRDAKVAEKDRIAAGNELATAYLDREKFGLQNSGAVLRSLGPVATKDGATVILRNRDIVPVHVTIREVGVPMEIADTWNPVIRAGETFIYPRDDINAPHFKALQAYEVTYWRERANGTYSQSPPIHQSIIKTSVKPRWSGQDQIYFFGGLEFLPGSAYE